MIYQHSELAAGRWHQLSFLEQMANVGSEVERALNWKLKGNSAYCLKASERALELMDLTLADTTIFSHLKELSRVRETLADYFFGDNEFQSSDSSLRKYFLKFTYAARKDREQILPLQPLQESLSRRTVT